MATDENPLLSLLEPEERKCVNCGEIAHVPRYEDKWTCYGCGRVQRRKDEK